MGKKNKSKRFIQQGRDAVMKHDARFPYRGTLADAEKRTKQLFSWRGLNGGTYYFSKHETLFRKPFLVQVVLSDKNSYTEQKTLCSPLILIQVQLKKYSFVKCKSNCKVLQMHIKKRGPKWSSLIFSK